MISWVPLSPPHSHVLAFFPHLHCAAIVAPAQGAATLARQQPPCQGAATPAAGAAAPVSGKPLRAGHWRSPLVSCRLRANASMGDSPYGLALAAEPTVPLQGALATTGCPCSQHGRGWPPEQRAWPWPATLAGGLACCPLFTSFAAKMQQKRVE
ncbi:hypothetical protein B296_00046587 [Ensete ventricosum]|uniref:Uncharacterized protein n=1 Tax=Ensete ventricosum TaxID=4639 RepID=A0A426X9X6_ENSVE|nr:hypothetical protein B296_00046587 [Ensete ventricosum]